MAKKDKAKKHEQGTENSTQRVSAPEGEQAAAGNGADTAPGEVKKGSNAPRARKFDYGIKPDAKVVRLVETANVKRDIQEQFKHTEGDPTVQEFYDKGGDRHGLRVMSRRKLIKIVHVNEAGDVVAEFPKGYTKPEKAAEAPKGEQAVA